MRLTSDNFFADSNIFIYLFASDEIKKHIAEEILFAKPVISTQVISENINVLLKKFPVLKFEDVLRHYRILISSSKRIEIINPIIIEQALFLKPKYKLNWYDCLIVSSALAGDCTILYSEDLQHLQRIEDKLTIVNPFLNNG